MNAQPGPNDRSLPEPAPVAVLLPGLWMPAWVMALLGRRLADRGIRTLRFGYAGVSTGLAGNAERLARVIAGIADARVSLVGHSLGGLVAIEALRVRPFDRAGRVVLLGSPWNGSHAATRLARCGPGRGMLGRSMADWLARPAATLPAGIEVGVVAGSRGVGMGMLVAPDLPRPHDGAVTVDETTVPGMRDRVVLPVTHSSMILSAEVARQVAAFLHAGAFDHAPRALP